MSLITTASEARQIEAGGAKEEEAGETAPPRKHCRKFLRDRRLIEFRCFPISFFLYPGLTKRNAWQGSQRLRRFRCSTQQVIVGDVSVCYPKRENNKLHRLALNLLGRTCRTERINSEV